MNRRLVLLHAGQVEKTWELRPELDDSVQARSVGASVAALLVSMLRKPGCQSMAVELHDLGDDGATCDHEAG